MDTFKIHGKPWQFFVLILKVTIFDVKLKNCLPRSYKSKQTYFYKQLFYIKNFLKKMEYRYKIRSA